MSNTDLISLILTGVAAAGVFVVLYALIFRKASIEEPDWWGKEWDEIEPAPKPRSPSGVEK
jgi:hypothetical protein